MRLVLLIVVRVSQTRPTVTVMSEEYDRAMYGVWLRVLLTVVWCTKSRNQSNLMVQQVFNWLLAVALFVPVFVHVQFQWLVYTLYIVIMHTAKEEWKTDESCSF